MYNVESVSKLAAIIESCQGNRVANKQGRREGGGEGGRVGDTRKVGRQDDTSSRAAADSPLMTLADKTR